MSEPPYLRFREGIELGPVLRFFVEGKPQTAGSKSAFVIKGTNRAVVTESGSKESKARKKTWRGDLRDAAQDVKPDDWDMAAPMEVRFTFVRKREGQHLRSGKHAGELKDWALGLLPIKRPDALKLARAAEDALTGILWADDSQITDEHLLKRFGDQVGMDSRAEGILVEVRTLQPLSEQARLSGVPD